MRQLKIQKSITNRNSEALDKYLVEIGREVNRSDASWRRVGDDRIEAIRRGAVAHKRPQDSLYSTTC